MPANGQTATCAGCQTKITYRAYGRNAQHWVGKKGRWTAPHNPPNHNHIPAMEPYNTALYRSMCNHPSSWGRP